jgi:hypothetical protein
MDAAAEATDAITDGRPMDRLMALPQELLWAVWQHCRLVDLMRMSSVSTAMATSVVCFLIEKRLDPNDGIRLESGRAVVGFLTWWLRMTRHEANSADAAHALVVECFDADHRIAIAAWARHFGCTARQVAYRPFRSQYVYLCVTCCRVSPLSMLGWGEIEYIDTEEREVEALCTGCRELVYESCTLHLDGSPVAEDNDDPRWTRAYNGVVVTARLRPHSVEAPMSDDQDRAKKRPRRAEKKHTTASNTAADQTIQDQVVEAFDRKECWLPLAIAACPTRTSAIMANLSALGV